jgi:hypothetical protein
VREPESLGAVIAQSGVGTPRRKKQKLDLLRSAWSAVVGERAAPHSEPARLARGTLFIAADGPAWAAELGMLTEQVKRAAASLLGEGAVRKVKVQARPREGTEEASATAPRGGGEPTEGWRPEGPLGDSLEQVEDEEMRKALLRLARAGKVQEKREKKRE